MDIGGLVVVAVNVVLALACGWPLAVLLAQAAGRRWSRIRVLGALIVVYVTEAAAFAASMGTDILSVGLAVVWGLVLGSWLRRSSAAAGEWGKLVRSFALYTSLPAVSFLSVPVVGVLTGASVLDSEAGIQFGVPAFLPWPLRTILGFCVLVAGFAVVAKVVLTTAVAGVLILRAEGRGRNA